MATSLLFLNLFRTFSSSSISVVDFEVVFVCWVREKYLLEISKSVLEIMPVFFALSDTNVNLLLGT